MRSKLRKQCSPDDRERPGLTRSARSSLETAHDICATCERPYTTHRHHENAKPWQRCEGAAVGPGRAWLHPCLMRSVTSALERPWVLDIDATIKPLSNLGWTALLGSD